MNSTEPIAVTTGYYGGQPTVRTLDKSLVLPVGLALYPQPAAQGDALDVVLDVVLDAFENKTRGIPQAHIAAALVAELRAAIEAASTTPAARGDTEMLDWLNENIFYREMGEWDAKYGPGDGYNMWVLFSPKGVQGSARTIISAARAAQEGKSHE